jgi:hypothetical protein
MVKRAGASKTFASVKGNYASCRWQVAGLIVTESPNIILANLYDTCNLMPAQKKDPGSHRGLEY